MQWWGGRLIGHGTAERPPHHCLLLKRSQQKPAFCCPDGDLLQRQHPIDCERVLDCHLPTTPRMHVSTSEARESPDESTRGQYLQLSADVGGLDAAREPADIVAAPPDSRRETAVQHALLSAFCPGAAQMAQGRWVTGLVQFGVVAAYLAGVFAVGPTKAIWLAVFWNAYSALEAYWYERD